MHVYFTAVSAAAPKPVVGTRLKSVKEPSSSKKGKCVCLCLIYSSIYTCMYEHLFLAVLGARKPVHMAIAKLRSFKGPSSLNKDNCVGAVSTSHTFIS